MTALRVVYRVALPVFFGATSSLVALYTPMYFGKWVLLGLLFLLGLGTPKPRADGRLGWAGALVVAFVLTGLLSFADAGVTSRGMLQLGSVALGLLTSSLLAQAWQTERGRLQVIEDFSFAARIVVWSSFVLLVAGLNYGRLPDRFSGWSSNPNSLGAMLCLLWPAVLQLAMTRPGWGLMSHRLLACMAIVVLAATGSRSAVLGVLASTLVLLACTRRLRSRALVIALILGVVGFVFGDTLSAAIQATPGLSRLFGEEVVDYLGGREGAEFKASGREAAWAVAVRLIDARPVEGYGWGAEEVLLPTFAEELAVHQGENVHNSYLSLLLQVGLLGAVPICLVFGIAAVRGVRGLRRSSSHTDPRRLAAPVLLSVLGGALTHALFESWLFAVGNLGTLIFWPVVFLLLRSELTGSAAPASFRTSALGPVQSHEAGVRTAQGA